MRVHFIDTYKHIDNNVLRYINNYVNTHLHAATTHTHAHTNTTQQVNSADFPCQLLGRHWFKETSICDVSTYLMNPHRSMEGLVCYTRSTFTAWLIFILPRTTS